MKSKDLYAPIHSRYYVMKFGKYKGHTVKYILDHNPSYIIWIRHHDIYVTPRIYNMAQSLYEQEVNLKTLSYSHLNHNYSSYYDDEPSWLDGDYEPF